MKCYKCQSTENLTVARTFKSAPGKKYTYHICRSCNTIRQREKYAASESFKEAVKRNVKKYEARHPERYKAWGKASALPLLPCEVCGARNTHRHHDDISRPLEVRFLCPLHHKEADMV